MISIAVLNEPGLSYLDVAQSNAHCSVYTKHIVLINRLLCKYGPAAVPLTLWFKRATNIKRRSKEFIQSNCFVYSSISSVYWWLMQRSKAP